MRRLGLAILLFAAPVHAEDKARCRTAFESAQTLRDGGKLTAAREEMNVCTQVCPPAFAKVCDGWLVDVEKSIPSIVVRAADPHGQDLVDVELTIDGKKTGKLEGKAIALDPGSHKLSLTWKDETVERDVVVVEGEKNRAIVVTFAAKEEPPPAPPRPKPAFESSPPIAAYVAWGLGAVALGGFAYFGLKGDADHKDLVDGCSKTASCTQDDKDRVQREWHVADAFLVSSLVLVGVGTYLYFTHDDGPRASVGLAPGRATLRIDF